MERDPLPWGPAQSVRLAQAIFVVGDSTGQPSPPHPLKDLLEAPFHFCFYLPLSETI